VEFVPCTKSIKRSKVRNISTERLLRRRNFILHGIVPESHERFEQKYDFYARAAELCVIEDTLEDRGEFIYRATLPRGERGRVVV
jgi:hypothetical protein